ncbi:rhodanese-like domain-containing protein [Kitasatospora aureofaciens]|uniref:rhodanese-like domain-containing protein n=1 Tax=Kitasatospora aureofaciens TaxID=1894 RepID=UPI001C448AAD|nr:rhodanese-like domain-containing protein [Kitasatospora aureofaciens]MBV6701774.1 rhodanese-like domain-containing protein [Kitasatospora aureofaciens]
MTAQSPARWTDPEQQELEERVAAAELAWLSMDVDVQTLRVEIDNFALIHHQLLGPLYARLDELDALVAEAVAARTGRPEDLRRAAEARQQVEELPDLDALFDSVQEQREQSGRDGEPAPPPPAAPAKVRPGREAQRIYRELVRRAHPDLTTDPAEQQRRAAFLVRVNEAYAFGDAAALAGLAAEWSTAPEAAPAPDAPDRLEWLRRRLEWLTAKIAETAAEQVRLEQTPMGELLALAPQDPDRLLEQLAEELLAKAADRQAELARLLGDPSPVGDRNPSPAGDGNPPPVGDNGTDPTHSQESHTMFAQIPSSAAASVPADAVLLDVREQDEWDAGHADGALHIPLGQVIARLGELPDEKLYVLCRVGGRSAQVVQYLVQQGRDAVNVDGGMYAWESAGRPMVSSTGQDAYVL